MSSQRQKDSLVKDSELPAIPDKLYFTIGEVAGLCHLRPHVLRYWEQEFSELSPSKRRGNRRYYQRKDVLLIRKIRSLLYLQGYTIDGARQQLSPQKSAAPKDDAVARDKANAPIRTAVAELESLLEKYQNQ